MASNNSTPNNGTRRNSSNISAPVMPVALDVDPTTVPPRPPASIAESVATTSRHDPYNLALPSRKSPVGAGGRKGSNGTNDGVSPVQFQEGQQHNFEAWDNTSDVGTDASSGSTSGPTNSGSGKHGSRDASITGHPASYPHTPNPISGANSCSGNTDRVQHYHNQHPQQQYHPPSTAGGLNSLNSVQDCHQRQLPRYDYSASQEQHHGSYHCQPSAQSYPTHQVHHHYPQGNGDNYASSMAMQQHYSGRPVHVNHHPMSQDYYQQQQQQYNQQGFYPQSQQYAPSNHNNNSNDPRLSHTSVPTNDYNMQQQHSMNGVRGVSNNISPNVANGTTTSAPTQIHGPALAGHVRFLSFEGAACFPLMPPTFPKTNLVRMFIGQLPYSVSEQQLAWMAYTLGGGVQLYYLDKITKADPRRGQGPGKMPTGCYHCYVEPSFVDNFVRLFNDTILVDDAGVWAASNPEEQTVLSQYCLRMKNNTSLRVPGRPYGTVVVQRSKRVFEDSAKHREYLKQQQQQQEGGLKPNNLVSNRFVQ